MPKGWNSALGYTPDTIEGLQESLGRTIFGPQNRWAQIINGLILQGGIIPPNGEVEFSAPFNTQVFGVFINGGTATEITLNGFKSATGGHWFAIGV